MSLLPDRLGRTSTDSMHIDRVARAVRRVEVEVTEHEICRWGDQQNAETDMTTRFDLTAFALNKDLQTYDRGMVLADGDPVKQELVLRYVQDGSDFNRGCINRALS
jgi:hypothetical protein